MRVMNHKQYGKKKQEVLEFMKLFSGLSANSDVGFIRSQQLGSNQI